MAQRISNIIELGRADNLTLQQIATQVTKKFRQISRTRAALISRTETHNAASSANHSYHATLAAEHQMQEQGLLIQQPTVRQWICLKILLLVVHRCSLQVIQKVAQEM